MEEEATEEELLDIPQTCTDQQRKREKMAAEGGRIVYISPQPPARSPFRSSGRCPHLAGTI